MMKHINHCLLILIAALCCFSSCRPASNRTALDEKFKTEVIERSRQDVKKLLNAELDASSVKVVNTREFSDWVASGPWKNRELPCEIKDVITQDRGNIDPSPIALDVSGSFKGKGTRVMYVPVRSKVNCASPRNSFVMDDDDCNQVMVCAGEVGFGCTCDCYFPCDATEKLCGVCEDP